MATAKKTQIVITANAAVAKKVMDELQQRIDGIKQKMAALDVTTKSGQREFKKLEKELVSYNSAVSQNITNTERINKAMKNLSGTSLNELKRALSAAKSELGKMSSSSKGLKEMQGNVKALQSQIDKLTGSVHKQGGAWQTALKDLTAYVGMFGAFNMLRQKLTDIINFNLKYSDSLADIRKVSNLSMKSVNELSDMLATVDSRTSLEGLTKLAYVGSRMGMGKYGAEGLYEFAKASDRVNVALHEDLGDDAMLTLSKFVETMGEVEKHGGNISSAFDSVASSIFKLAASSTSNGSNILEFSKRLTGLAKVTKVSSDQLLGLASASDSLMLMPEVASTAFGKLLSSLWNNYHSIESMLGMQRDSLKSMIEEGRTMDALVTVLKNVSDKNLNSMDEYFKEFGSDGQRLKQVVVTMAQNVNVLEQHLDTSNEAYREGTAVVKEYQIQQQTAQAILERANNMWEKAFVNPDGIDSVKEMAKVWYNFSKSLTHSQPFLLSVRFLFVELSLAVKTLLAVLPGLVAYLGTRGLIAIFSKLIPLFTGLKFATMASNIILATQAVAGNAAAVRLLTMRWNALNLAMKANVIGLVLGVVTSLGFGLYELFSNTEKATGAMKRFDGSLDGVRSQANQAVGELNAYYRAITNAKTGTNQRTAAIKQFNEKFGSYLSNLLTEKSTTKDLAKAYREAADAIKAKIYLQMKEKDIKEQYTPRVGWSLDRLNEYGEVGKGTDSMVWLKAYEADSRGKDMHTIAQELAKRFKTQNTSEVLKSYFRGDESLRFDLRKIIDPNQYGSFNLEQTKAGRGDEKLFRALRYISQARSANNSMRNIDKKYNPVQKEIDDFLTKDQEQNTLIDDDDDGKGGKGGKGGSTGNPNRDEKNVAKDRANALIANIKAFYEEQMRKYLEWVAQMNADGEKISEGQQKEQMDYLQSQMNKALGTARQSIATLDSSWQEFFQRMDEDVMVYDEETSKQLLESIGKSDIAELHKLFTKLSGDLSRENNRTLAENLGALLDQMFANGSKELREAAENLLARQREIQNILNEHDYTGTVNRKTRSDFDRIRFLHPAKGINVDTPDGQNKMNAAFDKLTTKARESITELYKLNPESKDFQDQFLRFLSVANEGFDFSKLTTQDLKAMYLELIKYSDEYTAAEKKNADERKKINDFLWERQGFQSNQDSRRRAMQQVGSGVGRFREAGKGEDSDAPRSGETGGSKFMDEFSYNANLEQSKLEIILIQEKIAWLQKYNATSEQVAELQKSLAEKQDSYILSLMQTMKQRTEAIYTLYKPLEDFGTAAGQAFATMTEDAEAGRDAFKAAIGDMINAMMKQTVEMTQEYIKRRLMQKVNDKLVSAQIKKSTKEQVSLEQGGADATSAITEAAGDAKVMLTEQVGKQVTNAVTAQTQATTATSQAAAVTDVNTQAAKTTANVGLGIAEGSAKTIGSLGWWGIPLIAVITAVLNGLLGFAMGKVSSLFGKGKDSNTNTKNTKVVSGMLTYDSGNVQDLKPFVGNDGSLYWATEDSKPHDGVSLLTHPTATTINGQPSLVAENGPELVIGRETTQAMMMNNPQLLKALVNYDRNYSGRRAYDNGNIAEASPAIATGTSASEESDIAQANTNIALLQAVNTLLQRLEQPIEAKIDMYGRGKLYDSMTKANQFMKNK